MGVPKFYRWISERYPCLSEVVKEFQLPEFDNLYLDMNGIIHVCSHPEDDNPHFRITEEQIFKDICHYIEFLFRMIKPRKVFFMAVDGVAPRAKMNQQRGRRFRSAREAEELIKKAQEKGETLPTEKRFDSNCITPGTPFMERLQNYLKYFVVSKISTDPLWQGPKIYLSGHETPGEGEHKVMDYIRYARSQPDHDPNTRHCLYGLDADLIMLGLTSHEPHFALLREEVRFGGKKDRNKRPATPEETTFHLLHLSLMREYLDYEFSPLKGKLPFEYNLENIIDDWILMGFLVGNDFIPHLPHLHIHHDALPLLWKTYMDVLPTLDGYLNEGGHLNLRRFEVYIGKLAQFDRDQFSDQFMDMKYLEGKTGRPAGSSNRGGARGGRSEQANRQQQGQRGGASGAFAALEGLDDMDEDPDVPRNGQLPESLAAAVDSDDSDDDFDTFDAEFSAHKRDYYMTKMEYENVTPEVLQEQAHAYVRAIQWILLYYFEGVQSWSWYYPHHYAPYISDVRDFSNMQISFDMSEPFKPFEQLMAVLPAASKELLPIPLQSLMTEATSPVVDYYPIKFKTDLNGKQQDWEAVVLIPFIDENRLLSAMRTREHLLTETERRRNSHGPCCMYQWSPENQGLYVSPIPGKFPDIAANHAKLVEIPKFHFCIEPSRIKQGLLDGVQLNVFYPGFPTLRHIPHQHYLKKAGVKVFQHNSRGFNMMLKINEIPERSLDDIANDLLGQVTFVGWPHLHEAKVYAVADEKYRFELEEHPRKGQAPLVQWKRKELNQTETEILYKQANSIKEKYHDRFGVEVGKTTVLVFAGTMTGRKYVYTSHGKVTAEKQFSTQQIPFALQATCKDVLTHASDDMHFRTMEELYPKGAAVFMIGNPHYGCQGEVLEVDAKEGRVRVSFSVPEEPNMQQAKQADHIVALQYMPGYIAAQRLGVSTHFVSRITGTILILRGDGGNPESRANIGLNLKFTKRGEEVPGYTKKTDDGWQYSERAVETIHNYMSKFAELWDYIAGSQTGGSDIYTEAELFEECDYTLKDVLKYLEELPSSKITPMKSSADILQDETIMSIERAVDIAVEVNRKKVKRVKMQVRPHLLFRPLPNQGTLVPDPGTTFEMMDRIVVVKMGYSVPFGLRGTIVGIHPGELLQDTMFDVIFDEEFVGGITLRCSKKRGYRVPPIAMLNLSHGQRLSRPEQQQSQSQPKPSWKQQRQQGWQQSSQAAGVPNQSSRAAGGSAGLLPKPAFVKSNVSQAQNQRQAFNGYGSMGQPQFVTPRVISNPNRASQPSQKASPRGPPTATAPGDSEFANMWSALQQSTSSSDLSHTSSKKPGPSSSAGPSGSRGTVSLQSAAQALGKISLPTPDLLEGTVDSPCELPTNPPTALLVDLSDDAAVVAGSSSRQAEILLEKLHDSQSKGTGAPMKTMIVTNSRRSKSKSPNTGGAANGQNPTLQAMFEQAQKANPQSTAAGTVSDEFSALFAALQTTPSSTASQVSTSTEKVKAMPSCEIGQEDSGSVDQSSKKSYGRQVSIQELFDGAKQVSAQKTEVTSELQQQIQQQPQQMQQVPMSQLPQTSLPPPPLLATQAGQAGQAKPRNPVEELAAFCQATWQQPPKYDCIYHAKQKGFIGYVILPTSARFEGSMSSNKDEAHESAASMALLCLRKGLLGMPPPGPRQWMGQGAGMGVPGPGGRFFSPNSAFSPVPNPMQLRFGPGVFGQLPPPQQFMMPPGQQGRAPLLSQPPPRSLNRGPWIMSQPPPPYCQAPQWQANQIPPHSRPANHVHPQQRQAAPANQNASDRQMRTGTGGSQEFVRDAEDEVEGKQSSAKPSAEAFIPMQVTRKQRRKEDTPEKHTPPKESSGSHPANQPQPDSGQGDTTPRGPHGTTETHSVQSNTHPENKNMTDAKSSSSTKGAAAQHKTESESVAGNKMASKDRGAEGGKKRRPRIAANLNFGSSK
ncbi:hypothetical protein BaRGS_00032652 [Batillaria attramentaria]|uniref:DRBM domain-containing protein n=1 Tax=Batillaria attramentaria TaxID=370345 RepID=A0ABD0JN56_9CAEN